MPLTLVHPVAVIPFRRSGLPLSALVIGSYAPDMEYWRHLEPVSTFSHTLPGLLLFCLPAGLLALWIFHRVWKPPMVTLLNPQHHHHARPFPFGPWPRFLLICAALLIGSVTHIALDAFTHVYGWAVQRMPSLHNAVPATGRLQLPLYQFLQHLGTLLGGGILLFTAFYHRKWTWPAFAFNWPLVAVVAWMTIVGGVALGMLVAGDVSNAEGLKRWVGSALVVAATIQILVTTFLCLVWHLRQWMNRRSEKDSVPYSTDS